MKFKTENKKKLLNAFGFASSLFWSKSWESWIFEHEALSNNASV